MNLFLKKFNQSICDLDKALFFRQLSVLMIAGIPIIQSCEILGKNQKNKTLQYLITIIKINMESGHQLSWCLSQFPQYFDLLTCHLIQIGEQSGTLSLALDRIALHKEKRLSIKNKVKQALLYPAIVTVVALIISLIMLTLVIPRFAELFQSMHCSLPTFTLTIIHLSKWIQKEYGLIFLILLAFFFLVYYFHNSPLLRWRIELILLRTPYLGPVYMKTILARFCCTLATTFAAGLSISDSLKSIAHANSSAVYAQAILKLQTHIKKGQQLHQAMQKQVFFPNLLVQMVKIGEESGMLEKMLEKITNIYEADIDSWLLHCNRLLEPLIILILGVLIGGLVIAMYLPIFKLGTVV
ncbi:MAG: type secretion system family protein [Gammaproteobacteria bacterium]|jgi:type IV pilus assembly protein PilC|nr:type secretion system family protein [Gammaproteobacteria bacterium]